MPAPLFRSRESSLQCELFDRILERVARDLPGSVGLAVSVHGAGHSGPAVLTASGVGRDFVEAQLNMPDGALGPVVDAFTYQVPVLCPDLNADDRWPVLTAQWTQVCGAAAVPGVWREDETVVLSAILEQPATVDTVVTLIGYEQLITAAMITATAQDSTEISDMMAVLQSRGSIEQAKGVIMGQLQCDAETAWSTLRRASHESNVKLRVLAVALIEHIGGAPAEQPAHAAQIVPDEAARKAAGLLWAVLSHAPKPSDSN